MSADAKLKPFPKFETDAEAEAFVDQADLAEYDFSGFSSMQFEIKTKASALTIVAPRR